MNDQVGPDPDEEVKQHSMPSDPEVISEIQDNGPADVPPN